MCYNVSLSYIRFAKCLCNVYVMVSYNIELNNKPHMDGLYAVLIRVTYRRKHKKYLMDFRIPAKDLNKKAKYGKWVRSTNVQCNKLNRKLENKIDEIKSVLDNSESILKLFSSNTKIKDYICKDKADEDVFLEDYIKSIEADFDHSFSIIYRYCVVTTWKHFLKVTGNILVSEISNQHINNYINYLYSNKKSPNSVKTYLMHLKHLFKTMLRDNLILRDPMIGAKKTKPVKKINKKLSHETLELIKNYDPELYRPKNTVYQLRTIQTLHKIRDMYIFSYYNAGLRLIDTVLLRNSNIQGGRLVYAMHKTKKNMSFPLNKICIDIIEKYRAGRTEPNAFIFRMLSDKSMLASIYDKELENLLSEEDKKKLISELAAARYLISRYLKHISKDLKLKQTINFHQARHQFGMAAKKALATSDNITIFDVKDMYGHESVSTTQVYLDELNEERFDSIFHEILGNQ